MDALRSAAMLLGIAYHASLSFCLGGGWIVQDVNQSKALYLFQAFVHGFRMQLFMLLSGFFTALLWRKQGLKATLRHRWKRILLPCLVGVFTLVPAVKWAASFAEKAQTAKGLSASQPFPLERELWSAPEVPSALHPKLHMSILFWAVLAGTPEMVATLLEKGADPNWQTSEGHTALHGAAFFDRHQAAELLVCGGADINALNYNGQSPRQNASDDYSQVEPLAGLLRLTVQKKPALDGRTRILENFTQLGARVRPLLGTKVASPNKILLNQLVHTPVFSLLWFLWFLVWLTLLFCLYAVAADRFGWKLRPHRFVVTQRSLVWLVPFTALPTWFMKSAHGDFGPDTSMGILPMPHVLAYYALFFGFGVLYFESDDAAGHLGGAWRRTLPVTLCVVLPVALEFATGTFGLRDKLLPTAFHRPASVVFQALYAWMMSFAWMGMFRSLPGCKNRRIRYVSDASYWFYLLHLPLVIGAQVLVRQWPLHAELKFFTVCLFTLVALLLIYHKLVRDSLIGRFLNRPSHRSGACQTPT